MIAVRSIVDLQRALLPRDQHAPVGFVPTMGALHEGHAALFRQARKECRSVVASIFVNPKQFNDPRDLAAYPRTEEDDTQVARAAGVDVLFIPPADEIYPSDLAITLEMAGPALGFEADHRPGHFNGVALVCLKLFGIVAPDVAYFGQKDAQQVAVLQQLVRDANLPLELRVGSTIRDSDEVALSSRNARLSADERRKARAIPQALRAGLEAYRAGRNPVEAARTALTDFDIEYIAIANFHGDATLVLAARLGTTRLIDNVPLEDPARAGLSEPRT